jgi:glycerol-3-phosphate dehydrogenase
MSKNSSLFSAVNRTDIFSKLTATHYDLLVIGGGSTGAGIALDAASRGLKTALIEKEDFASGTSSKSTKLIHGGLRYLKQLDFALVRESGTERAIVHKLAPHLVLPEKMLLPLIKGGNYGKLATSIGLKVYDILAGVKGDDRRKMLSKKQSLALEPLLDKKGLRGGGFYAEYRTDDARLTIELIKTAVEHKADIINYAEAISFEYENDKISGVVCKDIIEGEKYEIKAKKIVTASGPWVDKIRLKDGPLIGKKLQLTKGVHLVFPHHKFPVKNTIYFDAPDGRMIFAIPRGKTTYVGTTDTEYRGNLDRVITTKKDATYLLDIINTVFPTINLSFADAISNWAGLRSLIHEDGKAPSELSRKDEIFISDKGLIAIAGGKLTGYRKIAQRVVDLVAKELTKENNLKIAECKTKNLYLTVAPFENYSSVEIYISDLEQEIISYGIEKYYAWYLVTNYGKASRLILDQMKNYHDQPELNLGRSELWYCLNYEMVTSLADFFVRRTGSLYFDIERIPILKEIAIEEFQKYLKWSDKKTKEAIEKLDQLVYDARNYPDEEIFN